MKREYDEETKRIRSERAKAWAKAHPERMRAAGRKYHAANAEKRVAAAKEWAAANPEKRKALDASSRQGRREALSERTKVWTRENPAKAKAIAHNKRARKRGAAGKHTAADTTRIRTQQGNKCAYCRAKLTARAHLDHITALSRGGANWPANLQWLCEPCNMSKHAKDPIEFAQSIGRLL